VLVHFTQGIPIGNIQPSNEISNDAVNISGLVVAIIGVFVAAPGVFGYKMLRGKQKVSASPRPLSEVLAYNCDRMKMKLLVLR